LFWNRARRQLRLSIFSLRNNIESSQLKIKCYDVLVLAKFLLSTAFSTAMSSAGEARLTDKIIKGFFFKTSLLYSRVPPFLSSCFFLSLSLSLSHRVSFSLSLSLSFCNCTSLKCLPFSLSHDLSSLLSTSRRTIVQSTPALCSICLVAKCSALSIGLDLSKPVDRRDESFQTDSVCPRVSFALPEGKQNSVAPFRCWFET
jgi:hypothetical protein